MPFFAAAWNSLTVIPVFFASSSYVSIARLPSGIVIWFPARDFGFSSSDIAAADDIFRRIW